MLNKTWTLCSAYYGVAVIIGVNLEITEFRVLKFTLAGLPVQGAIRTYRSGIQ